MKKLSLENKFVKQEFKLVGTIMIQLHVYIFFQARLQSREP